MSLWQDIQPFLDKETGLMTPPSGGRDNLILMTAYLVRELNRNGECVEARIMASRAQTFLQQVEVSSGLYRRLPGSSDDNSVDNLIGTCSLFFFHAWKVRVRWNLRLSCFDVNHPDVIAFNKNFYGRFIGLKAFILACAGVRPWLVQRLLWSASVFWSVHTSTGSSDPLLLSLQADAMRGLCPRTCRYWSRHYSLKQLYTDYFGADFPLVTNFKEAE